MYPSKAISAQSNLDLCTGFWISFWMDFWYATIPGGSGDVLFFCFRLYNPFLMVPLMKLLRMRWSQLMGCRVIGRYHRPEASSKYQENLEWSQIGTSHIIVNRMNAWIQNISKIYSKCSLANEETILDVVHSTCFLPNFFFQYISYIPFLQISPKDPIFPRPLLLCQCLWRTFFQDNLHGSSWLENMVTSTWLGLKAIK